MTLSALIRKRDTRKAATAIPAISATQPRKEARTVAEIATVAVASLPESANATPANERIEKMIAQLADDPGLIYAMQTHDEVEPDAVILTLAIRGKGACELRIPKSRYDGIELLELIEKHTTRETLQ